MIVLKRAYEKAAASDGRRVLVDRLWPRGVSRSALQLDGWEKEIAPSAKLRQWFNHDPKRWAEFKKKYTSELREHREKLRELKRSGKRITLVYGAKDTEHTHALVLKDVLDAMK